MIAVQEEYSYPKHSVKSFPSSAASQIWQI